MSNIAIPPTKLSFDENIEEHDFKNGLWVQPKGQSYAERTDVCTKCGCERLMLRHRDRGSKWSIFVSNYIRSMQVYPADNEPICWGKKNP